MLRLPMTTTVSMAFIKRSCRRHFPLRIGFIHQFAKTLRCPVSNCLRRLCRKGVAPTAQRHTALEGRNKDGDSLDISMKFPESSDVFLETSPFLVLNQFPKPSAFYREQIAYGLNGAVNTPAARLGEILPRALQN